MAGRDRRQSGEVPHAQTLRQHPSVAKPKNIPGAAEEKSVRRGCLIYYGTEQGFQGSGGDNQIREAMFDSSAPGRNLLNTDCTIYREIVKIAQVMRTQAPLRFGRMYLRQISGDGRHFGFPYGTDYTLAFSRLLYPTEILIAYNVSSAPREDHVVVDSTCHVGSNQLTYLYGGNGTVPVDVAADGTHSVQLSLNGHQFCILR